jgi:hypothetical protein
LTYNHLRVFGDANALSLNNLDIMQTAQNLVLHLERGAHRKFGTFLDGKGLVLERGFATGCREVDCDGWAAGRVHGQRENDADAGVVGVGDVFAAAEAEGFLVSLEGFVAGVYMCRQKRKKPVSFTAGVFMLAFVSQFL